MAILPASALETLPAIIFQFSGNRLEFLNPEMPPGLASSKLSKILRGGWEKLVPVEFHPVVRKLGVAFENPRSYDGRVPGLLDG